jgi:hypothetical protein
MRCFLLHGFNVRDDGNNTVDKLIPLLQARDIEPVQFDYGWQGLLGVRFGSRGLAKALRSVMRDGDIAIGHSNGCHLIHCAQELGVHLKFSIYIAPALDSFTPECAESGNVYVLHSRHDFAVKVARFLLFHRWGDMGAIGSVYSRKFKNINCSSWVNGHSGYFAEGNMEKLNETVNGIFDSEHVSKRVCEPFW